MRSFLLALLLIPLPSCGDDERLPPGAADAAPMADAPSGTPDAPPGTPDATPGTPDATPGAPDGGSTPAGVRCGDTTCGAGLVCCVDSSGPTATCQDGADPCGGDAYACDGPTECGGNNCCGDAQGGSMCVGGPATCPDLTLCESDLDCGVDELCCPPGGPTTIDSYDRCVMTVVCPG